MLISPMDGSLRLVESTSPVWHIDAVRGPSTPSLRGANRSRECAPDDRLRDEAIHSFLPWRDGLLRFARNDGIGASGLDSSRDCLNVMLGAEPCRLRELTFHAIYPSSNLNRQRPRCSTDFANSLPILSHPMRMVIAASTTPIFVWPRPHSWSTSSRSTASRPRSRSAGCTA